MKANRWTAVTAGAARLGAAPAPALRARAVPVDRAAMGRVALVGTDLVAARSVASAMTVATSRAAKRPRRCRTSM